MALVSDEINGSEGWWKRNWPPVAGNEAPLRFCSLMARTAAQHEDFAPVKWAKVSVSASQTVEKITSELEIEESPELHTLLHHRDAATESWRIQEQVCSPTCCEDGREK